MEILVSQPGLKPVSLALEDGLLTTGPPGKFLVQLFNWSLFSAPLPHASDFS